VTDQSSDIAAATADPGSFRDPANRVLVHDDVVYRALDQRATDELAAVRAMPWYRKAEAAGRIIESRDIDGAEGVGIDGEWASVLAHPRLDVWTYPYEWTFSMLQDAAVLQLELLADALAADATCKDATSFNVQFVGHKPMFIDVGSFERLVEGDPWYGYLQFCQLYLYPLLVQAYADVDFQPLLIADIDGITPDLANKILGVTRIWRKGVPIHVALHARTQRRFADSDADMKEDLKKAGFSKKIIEANVKGLLKVVSGLEWKQSESEWSSYENRPHYSSDDLQAKERFVLETAEQKTRSIAWDVGCNDGRFSRLVAAHCDHVVAMDSDKLVVDLLYRSLRQKGPDNIVPIVLDLSKPSPGLGWRGAERRPFLERNTPDLVLFLAVIHHVAITANVPLPEIIAFLRSLDATIVLEFPTEDDSMVRRLVKNKQAGVHDDYRLDRFEAALSPAFTVARREALSNGTRVMFELVPA
jgi:hypothetical protein